ncbi:MAG: PAS domain S-box protein [Acidobacteriota bacterium]|nr:MAG: PAS domain S-box protein [Acidobacteriota bacterium]
MLNYCQDRADEFSREIGSDRACLSPQEQVLAVERVFQSLANTADGVCAVDLNQRVVLWNEPAERLLDFAAEEVLGKHCYGVIGGTNEQGCTLCRKQCAVMQLAAEGVPSATQDVYARTKSGDRKWVNVTTILVSSGLKELAVVVHLLRDATKRIDLEREHSQLLARLADWTESPSVRDSSSQPSPALLERLTERERQVLHLVARGTDTDSIAGELFISSATVRNHVHNILQKLGVRNRLEALALVVNGISH